MFLQHLSLENVKNIRSLDMSFTARDGSLRKWTMLLGENGCGKSTVLKSIALVLAGSEALSELIGNPDSWIRSGTHECGIQATILTSARKSHTFALRFRRGDSLKDVFERNSRSLNELDRVLNTSSHKFPLLAYGASRRVPNERGMFSIHSEAFACLRARCVGTLFSPDASLHPLEHWAMELHYRLGNKGLMLVRDALSNLLPGVALHSIDKEKKQLLFTTSNGILSLSQLSDGYKVVVGWCGDLLYRLAQVLQEEKQLFATGGLLLIDEIDLHLHPMWKRQLVTFFSRTLPNFQIVATTHSALTAQQTGEGELFVLRHEKEESPVTTYHFPGDPSTLTIQQLLVSPMFGLTTVDSLPVEKKKKEYVGLMRRKKSSRGATERITTLRREIEALPQPEKFDNHLKSHDTVLGEMRDFLAKKAEGKKRQPSTKRR